MSEDRGLERVDETIWEERDETCDILDSTQAETPDRWRGVALGFFDGVHRGHQELLNALLYNCRRRDFEPSVFSFYRMPQKESFDTSERQYQGLIQEPEKRAAFLRRYGVKKTWMQLFNDRFKALEAQEFLDTILYERLGIRLVVAGDDFRFGKDRKGDAELLKSWGQAKGVEIIIVPSVMASKGVISSTRIKNAIIRGDFREVSQFLGHDYSMSGKVIRGNALGRTIGMPTANVAVPEGQLCPAYGVYVTRTRIGNRVYSSISNVGIRPTVNKQNFIPLLETYLFDVDMNLYGQEIEVYFLDYIRPELTFSSFLSMTASIQKDIEFAREWHREHEELVLVSRYNQIPVYTLAAKRFNTSIINIVMKDHLDPKRSAATALAARIVSTASERYPSRAGLQLAADNLYGASIGTQTSRQGDLQVIWFYADGIKQAIDGSEPFTDIVDILTDLMQHPLLDDRKLFDYDIFRTEQKNMITELKARRQDKSWYALNRSVELAAGGKRHALQASGDLDVVANLTREEVTDAWYRLMRKAQIEIFLAGDIRPEIREKVIDFTRSLPESKNRLRMMPGVDPAPVSFAPKGVVTESRDLEQARLVMLYQGLTPYHFNQQALISVLNSMLGGDAHSLLFNTVREEKGLAYQISSMTLRFLNVLIVQAGVAPEDVAETAAIVRESIQQIRDGEWSDTVFESSKRLLRNDLLSIRDNLSQMNYFHMENLACGSRISISEAIDDLDQVTPEQVRALAGRLSEVVSFAYGVDANVVEAVK